MSKELDACCCLFTLFLKRVMDMDPSTLYKSLKISDFMNSFAKKQFFNYTDTFSAFLMHILKSHTFLKRLVQKQNSEQISSLTK